ncbi:50S ribosomal protein L29 [bacterium BMS3Bbin02]|nr:50S ribosomal protein L29 [bacterium BMS3Bbin02]
MKTAELTQLTYDELREKLDEVKEELFNLRFQLATNQLDNTSRLGQVKKDIARIRTAMAQQEIAAWHRQQEDN